MRRSSYRLMAAAATGSSATAARSPWEIGFAIRFLYSRQKPRESMRSSIWRCRPPRDRLVLVADYRDQHSNPRRAFAEPRHLLPLIAFGAPSFALLPGLVGGFIHGDDGSLLLRNPWYRGLGPTYLAWMVSTVRMGHWMPLNWTSFGLDYVLWGMNPLGYHLTNLLLHAATAT